MANAGHRGHAYREQRDLILATSDICIECGHPGSDSIDYRVPYSQTGIAGRTLQNMKPCHQKPCPTCGKSCNRSKGAKRPTNPTSRDW